LERLNNSVLVTSFIDSWFEEPLDLQRWFQLTDFELEVLAREYTSRSWNFSLAYVPDQICSRELMDQTWTRRRLTEIESILGEPRFKKAIREVEEEGRRRFDEIEEASAKPPGSLSCNKIFIPRHFADEQCPKCGREAGGKRSEDCGGAASRDSE
jgi:predicted RNA-binding Zn-ribbon protein involved in translation (DUF1610 family)